jgi:hypothetical protein
MANSVGDDFANSLALRDSRTAFFFRHVVLLSVRAGSSASINGRIRSGKCTRTPDRRSATSFRVLVRAINAGASGYLLKNMRRKELSTRRRQSNRRTADRRGDRRSCGGIESRGRSAALGVSLAHLARSKPPPNPSCSTIACLYRPVSSWRRALGRIERRSNSAAKPLGTTKKMKTRLHAAVY